jgi:hypothetical protein
MDVKSRDTIAGATIIVTRLDAYAPLSTFQTRGDGTYLVGLAPGTYEATFYYADLDESRTVTVPPANLAKLDVIFDFRTSGRPRGVFPNTPPRIVPLAR